MLKKRSTIWYIAGIIFILYLIAVFTTPAPTDWSRNYRSDKKSPFGTYIFYHTLPNAFRGAAIEQTRQHPYRFLSGQRDTTDPSLFITIGNAINFSKADIRQMIRSVSEGNYLLIAGCSFSAPLLDTLQISCNYLPASSQQDKNTFCLKNSPVTAQSYTQAGDDALFEIRRDTGSVHFPMLAAGTLTDRPNVTVAVFRIGKGQLVLSSIPAAFSNIFLLKGDNARYTSGILSLFPDNIKKVTITDYFNIPADELANQSPLRYLLSQPALQICLYLVIILALIFALFQGKRKQRIIPVLQPPPNYMLRFIRTVGMLYYNQKDNSLLIQKRLNLFWERIRNSYGIDTNVLDDRTKNMLASKTGVDRGIIDQITAYAHTGTNIISDEQLKHFFRLIDLFHKEEKINHGKYNT